MWDWVWARTRPDKRRKLEAEAGLTTNFKDKKFAVARAFVKFTATWVDGQAASSDRQLIIFSLFQVYYKGLGVISKILLPRGGA